MTTATQQGNTYQFFQPLSPQEREALKEDIKQRGIQVPIELDNAGAILDGHHRWEIAQELGLPEAQIPMVVRDELETEADKIAHVLKVNLLRRKSVSPLTQAKCILTLKEARGIDTTTNHNGNTPRADTLSALWQELGLNPRSGRRYLQWYEELKDHPDVYEQVESGAKKLAHARREVGAVTKKPRKKKLLLQGKDPQGAMGFLDQVKAYATKHIAQYEDSKVLSHDMKTKQNKVILTLTIKV
jgi:hypothetical protein